MRQIVLTAALTLAMAASLCAPVMAQDHAEQPEEAARPDFSGYWGPVFDLGQPASDMLAKLPDNTVLIEDTGIVEFARGEFGGLDLTPEAQERAQNWQPEAEFAIDRVCLPPSIIYALQGPFPFEIFQMPEVIIIKNEYFDQVRLVFMEQGGAAREYPADAPHSKMGFSTGRFEGADLVIETSHIAASTITNNGLDHSENITMVERYRIDAETGRLLATQWFSDPEMIANNGARWIEWTKREGQFVYPYECDPSFALEYGAGE